MNISSICSLPPTCSRSTLPSFSLSLMIWKWTSMCLLFPRLVEFFTISIANLLFSLNELIFSLSDFFLTLADLPFARFFIVSMADLSLTGFLWIGRALFKDQTILTPSSYLTHHPFQVATSHLAPLVQL